MGASGGGSPEPWSQFSTKTIFLRVPLLDWAAVKHGSKTEFRAANPKGATGFGSLQVPTPVVAWTKQTSAYDSRLMVLTATWNEPLGAISEESLRAEGFHNMAAFRRYWTARTKGRFKPLDKVWVYRLRQWDEGDEAVMGAALIRRLYKEHL